jgi:serine/threonine protein kinase
MGTNLRQIDKYTLQERLGLGGMAEVWKARDTQLQRYVAIKLLHANLQKDPNFVSRFEYEAQLIAALHHPNIIQIYDFRVSRPPETSDTLAYMVMDYVEGQTLAQYLRNTAHRGKFSSYPTLLQLFAPICLAVDYAHRKGMIHRDIKPSNILLDRRNTAQNPMGEPILSDFGIARLLGASSTMQIGWQLGTPSYISPEQVMGAPGNELSDIYALSVILYEACTGTIPFRGDNTGVVMMQHVNTKPIAPLLVNPHIPPALADIILCGLSKNPADRFPSASALCIAVSNAVNVPLPDNIKTSVYQTAETDDLTYIRPISVSNPSQPPIGNVTPTSASNPSQPPIGNVTPTSVSNPSQPPIEHVTPTPTSNPSLPTVVGNSTPILTPRTVAPQPDSPRMSSLNPLASVPSSSKTSHPGYQGLPPYPVTPPPQNIPLPPQATSRSSRKVVARVLVAIAILVACLGTLLLLMPQKNASPVVAAPTVFGHAFFISSGQLDPTNSRGINDEILLDLQNIPNPPAGKVYYGWLLGDKAVSEPLTTPLGRLNVDNGRVHLFYAGNQAHTNLLAIESRILITAEDASFSPSIYTPDTKCWVYYAELSQAPSPRDALHFTMLDHLRHLLSNSPELQGHGLSGGLDMWFLRNTQKILEWSNAARDDWQTSPDLLHRQVVRVLDYLDGAAYVQQDAPTVGPILLSDAHAAQIALLGPAPGGPVYPPSDQFTPGYVYLLSSHLAGAVLSPDATQEQRDRSAQIHRAIDQVKNWLEQIHQDAKQLVAMNSQQLGQPQALSLLDDMVTQAEHAYNGETNPLTGQQQGGAIWICGNIQLMAAFTLLPYKPS